MVGMEAFGRHEIRLIQSGLQEGMCIPNQNSVLALNDPIIAMAALKFWKLVIILSIASMET
jgi:hypothetical protein